ncbi:MAG: signal peptidase I [Lachnospiraceae bacterium]|nr:MAG: signal peptidase I [Lachnospiraceae bacterium]
MENKIEDNKNKKKMDKKSIIKEIRDYVCLIILAFVLAFLMNKFVYANAQVPTGSMIPVVEPGDRLIVNRLAYLFEEPKRGDIVMFAFPDDEKDNYLKRIIGLPGEKVEIKDGLVYINDSKKPLDEPYINDPPNGNYGPYNVPEGCYFMLGDNRDESKDARFWENKFVKKEKIVGKAWLKYYPHITILHSAEYSENN